MAKPSVIFEQDGGYWVAERDSVGFTGQTALGMVEFLITSAALAEMLNSDLDGTTARPRSKCSSSSRVIFTALLSVNSSSVSVASRQSF
jgi:hypothetical protein